MGKLAAAACEAAKPDPKRDRLIGDGDGLFLRVRPNGTKTWVIEYELEGSRTKYTIGRYTRNGPLGESISGWLRNGEQSLSQARSIAGSWKACRRAGRNPAVEWENLLTQEREAALTKASALEAERKQPTVNDVVEAYMVKIMAGKKSGPGALYRFRRLTEIIGSKKIKEVTRQDIIAALDIIAAGKREGRTAKQLAGEVLTQTKRLWRFAQAREWVAVSCVGELTRRDFDARPKKRDVTLRLDELAMVWRTLDDRSQCKAEPVTIAAMKLLILTGQRENEVTHAQWTELDLQAGLWKIPLESTKLRRAHLVHLAPQAIAILKDLKRVTGQGCYVFESPLKPGRPIYGRSVNNALGTLFKGGKLPNVTRCHVHDFRRTLITRLPDLGFEPFLGHKIANHVLSGVFAHYNHNTYEEQREKALKAWACRLETLAAGLKASHLGQAA